MYRYVRFGLTLIALSKAAIIDVHIESHRLHCEVYQRINYDGESIQIPESHKIIDFAQLTQSWIDSGSNEFYSFKLPSSIPSGTNCLVKSCTEEHFNGNCTIFKRSQERIQPYRLKSFECRCYTDDDNENTKKVIDVNSQQQCCEEKKYSTFQNFMKLGKTIIGVGRNYQWHKVDLSKVVSSGSSPEDPIIFFKPTSSYLSEGNSIQLPQHLGVIYYELELAVVIGKPAHNVSESNAMDFVAGYALALDMTAKEILKSSISKGLPWSVAKGFDGACPIGKFIPKSCIADPHDLQLTASINGITKQNDRTSQMIFKIPQLISYVSAFMTLEPNDVILTGTPDGFGAVQSGDVIEGSLNDDLAKIKFVVA